MNIQIQTKDGEITSVQVDETLVRNVVAAQLGYSDAGRLMFTLTFADEDEDGPSVQGESQYL